MGHGLALNDWYQDATSVPFDHLLIDLSLRTDDRLRYCTIKGNIPSMFNEPANLKLLKYLDDEHTKSLYSPSLPALYPRIQNSVSKNLSKRSYPISQRMHRQPAARNFAGIKGSHVLKYTDNIHELFLKRTTWKQRRSLLWSQKGLLLMKTVSPIVINHLS